MAEYSLPLTAEGAVTAPSGTFPYNEPTAESVTYFDVGPVQVLEIPGFGMAVADGVNPLRFVVDGSVYTAGGIAPGAAPTLGVAGAARATVVGDYSSGNPNDGDTIPLTSANGGTFTATFKTTLVTNGSLGHQVKIAAGAPDTTYANLLKLVNGTGTHGTEYWNNYTFGGGQDDFAVLFNLEVSAQNTTADTITFRYTQYGTDGNNTTVGSAPTNFTWSGATNMTGGSDGTGTEPAAGTYRYFYTWYRSADGAETGRSPIATVTKTSNTNVTVTVADSADATFDYIRVYRTASSGVEFFLAGSVATGGGSLTDDMSDDDLVVKTPWNDLLHRAYAEGIPPRGRALAYWKGALWSLGGFRAAEFSKGTVAVTVGSAEATLSAHGPTARFVGRAFQVASTPETYTILKVVPATGVITLDRAYEGSTNGTASFTIKDEYDTCRLQRSVQSQYNSQPVEESPGRIDTDDRVGGTGLLATKSRLFAFSRTSVSVVTGEDAESWEIHKLAEGVGCVAPRLVVGVEGGGMFLSYDGIYAISPDESMVCLSEPRSGGGARAHGITPTIRRISWAHADMAYSYYDPGERVVVFGVPLDDAMFPNYEIVLDLQNSTWALYKRASFTCATLATSPDGEQVVLCGDSEGNIWHVGIGESDGFYGTEAVQTLSGSQTVRTLTVSGTPFSTSGDGEKGKPVIVLYDDGETVAYGKVASNTTSALTLSEDLSAAPAASDQIVLGGIAWQAKTGFTTFGEEYHQKILRSVTLRHAPATRGEYFLSFAVDDGSFSLCPVGTSIGDLTETDGKIEHFVQYPGDTHAINLRGFKPGGQAILRGGVFDLVMPETGAM